MNSYEVQKRTYTEKIQAEPKWSLVGIFADEGITGTSTKRRDEFNRLMHLCKRGKVDMIITKSISRFARNTLDCLKYTRQLKDWNVDVFFEEQGIHSVQPGAEFYITIYGSIAQSESENISANVRWGKAQSAKEGKVPFQYKRFLGYRRGEDGQPEIDPEQAEVVRRIYRQYLAGDSMQTIANALNAEGVPTASGQGQWVSGTIKNILTNEKYKGDAVLNKTYVADCLTKKVMVNNGERPKYYIENNHPAIIDAATFRSAQEELSRRAGKRKVKQIGTTTEQGRYSGKYALTDLLVCGECGTPYRRCTWTARNQRKVVWRCINRLDFGKKYCHHSPTLEESVLHDAIMESIQRVAQESTDALTALQHHIAMGLQPEMSADNELDIRARIMEIDMEFKAMLQAIASDTEDQFDEQRAKTLMEEKEHLMHRLEQCANEEKEISATVSRIEGLQTIVEGLKNHPMEYDDRLVRRVLSCVVVESRSQIKLVFKGGMEAWQEID